MISDLIRIIREHAVDLEDLGQYGDIVFRVRDDIIDLHITKMVRCTASACDDFDGEAA